MSSADATVRGLLALALVVSAARGAGRVASRLGQPPVVGEILVGILVGPGALGWLAPEVQRALFPASAVDWLRPISQVGLVLFMFLVGLEVDLGAARREAHRTLGIMLGSIAVPLVAGAGLGWIVADGHRGDVPVAAFCLFVGAAMAITAFPVLARLLRDRGMAGTRLGNLVLSCAAFDDVIAWCLLAVVAALRGTGGRFDAVVTVAWAAAFVVGAGVLRRILERTPPPGLAVCVALAFGGAWITEVIGVHAIFGAFVAGTCIPRREAVTAPVERAITSLAQSVMLPVFFAVVGMSVRLDQLGTGGVVLVLAVVAVAVAGKAVGAGVAARLVGESPADATRIAALMNTRGLTEVVVASVGRELGIIDTQMFTALVVMAVLTTLMAGPVLTAVDRHDAARPTGGTDLSPPAAAH